MASLFSGVPQTATSYSTSQTETPQWLQDAIYRQITAATNVAETPYTPYAGQLVAGVTAPQQQAWQQVQNLQGQFQPALSAATAGTTALTSAPGATAAAAPYLQKAGESITGNIQQFLNPYTESVTNQIAKLGARNLQENLLPAVSDAFVKAGQFGGTRMGEFGSRALRDTQESILNQQAQALQSGYGQALTAAQQEAARQAGLATTAGGLASTDLTRQQSALQQLAALAQQGQSMGLQGAGALEAAGAAERGITQEQLNAAYQQYQQELQYPKTQLDWLKGQTTGAATNVPTTQTQTGTTTGSTYSASPLAQLASGLSASAALNKLLGG
jgi:hypothetical protein